MKNIKNNNDDEEMNTTTTIKIKANLNFKQLCMEISFKMKHWKLQIY